MGESQFQGLLRELRINWDKENSIGAPGNSIGAQENWKPCRGLFICLDFGPPSRSAQGRNWGPFADQTRVRCTKKVPSPLDYLPGPRERLAKSSIGLSGDLAKPSVPSHS